MILSGQEIKKQVQNNNIIIEPFDERYVNPNSYNLRLHNELNGRNMSDLLPYD